MVMNMQIKYVSVTNSPIDAGEHEKLVRSKEAGAVLTFCGDVRIVDSGKEVISLLYEVHPSAQQVLERIVEETIRDFNIMGVAVSHRYGQIPIGETAFVVSVSSAHRSEAFEVCNKLVNEVKTKLPIWKFQSFVDGTSEWVNSA